jgi:hypothetical protein
MPEIDPSLDQLSQQNQNPQLWNPQASAPPRGLPPPQPAPYGVARATEAQQRWGSPGAVVGIGGSLGELATNYISNFNQLIGDAMMGAQDQDEAEGARIARLATMTMGGGSMGAEKGALGIYGGKAISALSPEEAGKLNAWLKDPNHLNEYFAGMHNPKNMQVVFGEEKNGKPYIDIGGPLYVNRQRVGNIYRKISPDVGKAYHGSLEIDDDWKGTGLGKKLSLAHLGVYQKTGINKSGVYAVKDGSAFWAYLGYLPTKEGWIDIKPYISDAANEIGGIDLQTRNYIDKVLKSDDPRSIWAISDITSRHPSGELIGNKLLSDLPWAGEFDLTNPQQMERMRINAGK